MINFFDAPCTYYALIPDPDTCMYDTFINIPWSLTLMHVCIVWCTYLWSSILDSECMHERMVHVSMMRQILLPSDEQTDKAILGVGLRPRHLLSHCVHGVLETRGEGWQLPAAEVTLFYLICQFPRRHIFPLAVSATHCKMPPQPNQSNDAN